MRYYSVKMTSKERISAVLARIDNRVLQIGGVGFNASWKCLNAAGRKVCCVKSHEIRVKRVLEVGETSQVHIVSID